MGVDFIVMISQDRIRFTELPPPDVSGGMFPGAVCCLTYGPRYHEFRFVRHGPEQSTMRPNSSLGFLVGGPRALQLRQQRNRNDEMIRNPNCIIIRKRRYENRPKKRCIRLLESSTTPAPLLGRQPYIPIGSVAGRTYAAGWEGAHIFS